MTDLQITLRARLRDIENDLMDVRCGEHKSGDCPACAALLKVRLLREALEDSE